jgi:pyruvate/2-oxoglutarate dehydrogenase complex dihydrolipoamide acyltransferase (E2) component
VRLAGLFSFPVLLCFFQHFLRISLHSSKIGHCQKLKYPMLFQFKFPEVDGLKAKSLKLLKYYVKEQQKVNEGDPMALVDVGIATVDVPAEKEGLVKFLHIPEGGIFYPGDVIYTLVTYGEGDRAATRWEYKTISVAETGLFSESGINTEALKAKLNSLGMEGWEMVTGIDTSIMGTENGGMVLVLKRQTWK